MSETGDLLKNVFTSAQKYGHDSPDRWRFLMLAKAQAMAEEFDLTDLDQKDDLIIQAINWDLSRNDKTQDLWIHRYFWPRIRELTGADLDYVLDATEAIREQRRHDAYRSALAEATETAKDALETNQPERAKRALEEGLVKSERALKETLERPILTVQEALSGTFQSYKKTQGIKLIGMEQRTIPELDEATGGLQGLNLITAKSGEGKTLLALQNMLDVLTYDEDTCAVIVSLDMLQERLMTRLLSNRSGLSVRSILSGATSHGWDERERDALFGARKELETLGRRIRILDRFNFPIATTSKINKECTRLLRDTECSKCLIIVDFFQQIPTPGVAREDRDDYRIDEMRALVDSTGYTMLLITESTKYDTAAASGGDAGGAGNVKGSNYIVMRSDVVWILRGMRTDQLNDYFTINEEGYVQKRLVKANSKDAGKNRDERTERAEEIRNALARAGKAAIWLKIDKARDGAEKTEFALINHFKKNKISPAFSA